MDNLFKRKNTRRIRVGDVFIGGGAPVTVQSMTNTDTRDVKATVDQIKRLEEAGCEIVRVAIPDMEAAVAVAGIKRAISVPLVADIHFDYRLALECIRKGVDKVRINPGNIGDADRVRQVVKAAGERKIPIRIGVNGGSLEKHLLEEYKGVTPEAMVESAFFHTAILEDLGFEDTVISLKASSVPMTIAACRLMSQKTDYPLHIGVTETGTLFGGTIKSSVGLGALLSEGIGDTVRVSLTGDPVEEVKAGREILKALGMKAGGPELISCPTCGRCRINLIDIANRVEDELRIIDRDIKVAVMGCAVNGPGEAGDADIGIAGGDGEALLFKKGVIIRKIPEERIVEELLDEIGKL